MELVIHGTKGGYKANLFSTPNAPSSLGDIRKGASTENPLGQELYSIAYSNGVCIFTKYIILRDSLRSFATGTIAFSLYLSVNKELSGNGADIITLLDKLYVFYKNKYVKENNLNNGETNLIQEDWSFVTDILKEYKEQDKPNKQELLQSEDQEPAYIYYKNGDDLKKYFDKPYQEEYCDYKQVFFVSSVLKDKPENPLEVLSNSKIELKDIDLDNEHYYLNNYDRNKGITIIANGKERSASSNNNSIRSKSIIEIKYTKDAKCFEPISEKGTILDYNIQEYLVLKGNQIFIKEAAFESNSIQIKKTITFEIKDRNEKTIEGASFKIGYENLGKIDGQHPHTFKGNELTKPCKIEVTKGNFTRTINYFIPDEEDGNKLKTIILEERVTLPIKVKDKDTNQHITDFQVRTNITNGYQRTDKLEFVDRQLDVLYDITIHSDGYEEEVSKDFDPKYNKNIEVSLRKKEVIPVKNYTVKQGDFGTLKNNQQYYSNSIDGKDVRNVIVPNKGFLFTHFLLDNDTITAQYRKHESILKKPTVIGGLVIGIVAISLGFWYITLYLKSDTNQPITFSEIQSYTEGEVLFRDKLIDYKNKFNVQKPEIEEKNNGFGAWLTRTKSQKDSTEYNSWVNKIKILEAAIAKRELINSKNFKELKKLEYSTQQESLKAAIQEIDSTKYVIISDKLGDISKNSLRTVRNKIIAILHPERSIPEQKKTANKESVVDDEIRIPAQKVENPTSVKSESAADKSTNGNSESSEIIKKLKGSTITIEELKNYKATNTKLSSSIQLYLDFWEIVKNNNSTKQKYDELLSKIKVNKVLKNSELKNFLSGVCINNQSFQTFNAETGKSSYSFLKELKNKE